MNNISKRQIALLHLSKKQKNAKRFYIQKARHFVKGKTISVMFLFTKSKTLYVTIFFMKFLKLAFIYKNYDTLRYMIFLYTKIQTLRKKQDNLRYVFIYKNPDILRYAIFQWIFWNCYLVAGKRRSGADELAVILPPWKTKRRKVGSRRMLF